MAAQKNDYSASSITVLEGLEAVRKRPGMYIGSTGERGLHHLVWEVVDNSVDEAMAGYATRVEVVLQDDGGVRVVDNGRGIPVEMHPMEKRPTVEVVMTILHAGGKFDSDSYAVSGGLHGVGVSVVNALSSRARRRDPPRRARLATALRALVPGPAAQGRGAPGAPAPRVTFWADPDIFETTDYNVETIRRRLQEMAFLNKGLTITLRDERNGGNGDAEEPDAEGYVAKVQASTPSTTRAGWTTSSRTSTRRKDPIHKKLVSFSGEGGRARRRGRDAVELRLHRVGPHLRQHDQHPRGRHPRGGLPRRR